MESKPEPVACSLTTTDAAEQVTEWADLQGQARAVEPLPTGVRMHFPGELESVVVDLARREAACCGFLDFAITSADDEIVLEVTSANPDALPVISLLAGVPLT